MHAALVHSFDAPPRYEPFDDPVPNGEEVLVKVAAAGLHPIVKLIASGRHYGSVAKFPFIPGLDGAGRLEDGSRVLFGIARPPYGSFAESSVTTRDACMPIPEGIDDATAAAISNPAMSSWAALTMRIHFNPGENVLILGATGTAGHLAVQIAKRLGAGRIVAVARDHEGLEKVGADAIVSLSQPHDALVQALREQIASNDIGIVLDYLWGQPAEALLDAISQKGLQDSRSHIRYIQIGNSAGPKISLDAGTLRSSGMELLGSGFGSVQLDLLRKSIANFLVEAAKKPFDFHAKPVPLRDVESLWSSKERLVFIP